MSKGSWLAACTLLLASGFWPVTSQAEVVRVRLVGSNQTGNPLLQYRQTLLESAIRAAGHTPDVRFCQLPKGVTSDKRAATEVSLGKRCNMLATSIGADFARGLSLVPVPIYLGGGGYRVLLHPARDEGLAGIRDLEGLKRLRIGSGRTWVDSDILRANGLQVVTSEYPNLFPMLKAGRFDVLPRAIFEVLPEVAHFGPGLAIDNRLLLHYPSDLFFYGAPENRRTNEIVAAGLDIMYHNGSFQALLRSHDSTRLALQQLDLPSRTVITLDNPYLSEEQQGILRRYHPEWQDSFPETQAVQ
ncbi:MAG: hypothetical protein ACRCYW_00535 [Aeromonas sp.]|uniref:hypothetical protein n=1 Tax=Aeromonas sp. TaxID=647 RepID=UPI003F2DCAC2